MTIDLPTYIATYDPRMSQKELGCEAMIDECIHILPKQENITGTHCYLRRYRNQAYNVKWYNERRLKDDDIKPIDGSRSWINLSRRCIKIWTIEEMFSGKGVSERQYTDCDSFVNIIISRLNKIIRCCKKVTFCEQKYTDHKQKYTKLTERVMNHLSTSRMSGSGRSFDQKLSEWVRSNLISYATKMQSKYHPKSAGESNKYYNENGEPKGP